MKKLFIGTAALLCFVNAQAQQTTTISTKGILSTSASIAKPVVQKKDITNEDIWLKGTFRPKGIDELNFTKDGEHYTKATDKGLVIKYNIANPKDSLVVFNPATVSPSIEIESYVFSDDEQYLLFSAESEPIYRHSFRAKFFVYNIATKKLTEVHGGKKVRYATFSPKADKVAFIDDNNLCVQFLANGLVNNLTSDGANNKIINGATDWVYEEEFAIDKGFFWSPDGNKIAYLRFDESGVKEYSFDNYGPLYPEAYKYKYPKAGEDNSIVTVNIVDLTTSKTTPVDIGKNTDQYIPRIAWTADPSKLLVVRMNRTQNQLDMLFADASTGKTNIIYTENSNAYIDIHEGDGNFFTFLKDNKRFVISSEKDGYNHLYLFDMGGKLINQITKGKWDVASLDGIDEKNGIVYYTSHEEGAIFTTAYSVKLDGTKKTKLSTQKGHNSPRYTPTFKYMFNMYSSNFIPPVYTINDNKGKQLQVLEDNANLKKRMDEYNLGTKEYFTFQIETGDTLNGWMIKPANFDPAKKYPVLMYVYGGPGSQTVTNEFTVGWFFWHQMMASKGYIIVSIDNRGTGARGAAFKKATYRDLGKYETEDQISGAKYLATLPYVDAKRIGIHGWSYGGYMSSLCITKGADYFKTAIAVAPVTTWRYYDSIYTERFLDTPQKNAKGYDDNSPINFVSKLKGNYLLVHGTADDNVHFQNSVDMVDALVKANKQFEQFFYPNKNHGIYGGNTRLHLYTKLTNYILEKL
jgi:dipeptidyl-peptidase-4